MRGHVRPLVLIATLLLVLTQAVVRAQSSSAPEEHKRILGIIPNYRTSPTLRDYQPLDVSQKFGVARDDSLDRGTFVLAALFAADAQLAAATPSFGYGVGAYGRYYSASFGDLVIGNFMTEAIYPTALRQDPRYFRRGTGSAWSRARYAMGQILLTHGDSGRTQFNFSEVLGNATAVGLSNLYYPDNRSVSSGAWKLSLQLGVDMVANLVKEFAPELDGLTSGNRRP